MTLVAAAHSPSGISDAGVTAALAVFVSLLWALCFPLVGLGLRESTPLVFATLRAAAGGLALIGLALATRRAWPRRPGDWLRVGGVALLSTSIGYGAMFAGGGRVPAGTATVLANVQPLLAAVLAVALLRERCGARRWLALFAAFAGVALLAGVERDGFRTDAGVGLLLVSALALAGGNLLLKTLAGRTDAVAVNGLQLGLGSAPLFAAAWLSGEPLRVPANSGFWFALLVLAGASTALGAVLWQRVLARAPLNQVNAVSFLIPAYGLPLMLAYGEPVGGLQWLGGALVLAGVGGALLEGQARTI